MDVILDELMEIRKDYHSQDENLEDQIKEIREPLMAELINIKSEYKTLNYEFGRIQTQNRDMLRNYCKVIDNKIKEDDHHTFVTEVQENLVRTKTKNLMDSIRGNSPDNRTTTMVTSAGI